MFQLRGTGGIGAPPSAEEIRKAKEQELKDVKINFAIFLGACLAMKTVAVVYRNLSWFLFLKLKAISC